MPEYEVEVTRTASETKMYRVTADTLEKAKDAAVSAACNDSFNNPGCPEYEVGYASRVVDPLQQK